MSPGQNFDEERAPRHREYAAGPRSRYLVYFALMLGCVLLSTAALGQSIFGTSKAHEQPTTEDAYWTLKDQDVDYPQELVQNLVSGCLVVEMDVSKSGRSKNIKVIESFPPTGVERQFRRALNRIRWIPVDKDMPKREERRQIRVDFCASDTSMEEARSVCAAAMEQLCQQ